MNDIQGVGHAMWDCRYHLVWIQNIGYKVRMILSGLGEASVQPRLAQWNLPLHAELFHRGDIPKDKKGGSSFETSCLLNLV